MLLEMIVDAYFMEQDEAVYVKLHLKEIIVSGIVKVRAGPTPVL